MLLSRRSARKRRRGTILPLLAVSFVALCGFVALAVDVGMMAVAKTDCQNAADSAALTASRTLNGGTTSMVPSATTNAQTAVRNNQVLSGPFQTSDLVLTFGTYHYDLTSQLFQIYDPSDTNPNLSLRALVQPSSGETLNMTRAVVSHTAGTAFAKVLGISSFTISARAVAAHRPRDVSVIFDFSGSMNNESDLWNCESYLGTLQNTPNNTDPVYPLFGAYGDTTDANLVYTGTDPRAGKCNISVGVLGMPPMVQDYFQSNRGVTPMVAAFNAVPYASPLNYAINSGDQYVNSSGTTTAAQTVQQIEAGSTSQLFEGYAKHQAGVFHGFTQGPNYWGNTFFIWPPDPNTYNTSSKLSYPDLFAWWITDPYAPPEFWIYKDWRSLYFRDATNSYPLTDSSMLWDTTTGAFNDPPGNYTINYKNILYWIKHVAPLQFPPQLRAGRILYYSSIPDDIQASAYNHSNLNSQITDPDQRFWKEYIDFTLGVWRSPFGSVQRPGSPACSYGPDFTWGTMQISSGLYSYAQPANTLPCSNNPYASGTTFQHINPADNPLRPRHRFWFGPMTMIQFLADTGLLPGTAHDISMYSAKLGIVGALQNMKINHPNDMVSLNLFSRPQYSNDPPNIGQYNNPFINLGNNYDSAINSLWFPPNSATTDVRPYDSNGVQTPRAYGDFCANTATSYGFMLAYNQFSANSSIRSLAVGGSGRVGAQRLVIVETDGMYNCASYPQNGFYNGGPNNSFYQIQPGQVLTSGGQDNNQLYQIAQAIVNYSNGTPVASAGYTPYSPNPGYPGFSQPRKPVIMHTIVFGPIFEPTGSGSLQTSIVQMMQVVSGIGGTVFPSSSTDPSNGYKWVIGTLDQRLNKLQQAFATIMNDGVAVTLVQ